MNGVDTEEWDPAVDSWLPEAGRYTGEGGWLGGSTMGCLPLFGLR